jgi:hypothetical protein
VHRLVIAAECPTEVETLELVQSAKWLGIRISLFPSVLAALRGCAAFHDIDGMTLLGVPRFGLSHSSRALKRAFDLIGASLGLILLSPLLLLIAALIKFDSPSPRSSARPPSAATPRDPRWSSCGRWSRVRMG